MRSGFLLLELGNEIVQFSHIATEPVEAPHHEGVAFAEHVERGGEFWPRLRSSADVLLENAAALSLFERIELQR